MLYRNSPQRPFKYTTQLRTLAKGNKTVAWLYIFSGPTLVERKRYHMIMYSGVEATLQAFKTSAPNPSFKHYSCGNSPWYRRVGGSTGCRPRLHALVGRWGRTLRWVGKVCSDLTSKTVFIKHHYRCFMLVLEETFTNTTIRYGWVIDLICHMIIIPCFFQRTWIIYMSQKIFLFLHIDRSCLSCLNVRVAVFQVQTWSNILSAFDRTDESPSHCPLFVCHRRNPVTASHWVARWHWTEFRSVPEVSSPHSTGNESGKVKTKLGCVVLASEFRRDVPTTCMDQPCFSVDFLQCPKRHNITQGFVASFAYRFHKLNSRGETHPWKNASATFITSSMFTDQALYCYKTVENENWGMCFSGREDFNYRKYSPLISLWFFITLQHFC